MDRVEKTVFISYRRTDESWGLAIFQDLTQHGYDVFIDYDGIAGGDFETVILENIRARAHFLVLLTPTALARCGDPEDWMRREIEAALDSQRNIVPLMLPGFDFSTPATAGQLTGKLAALKKYNGLEIPKARFFASEMERLRDKYLNVPVEAVLHPASDSAQQVAKEQKDKAGSEAKRRAQEETQQRTAEQERRKREAEIEQRRKKEAEAKRQEEEAQRRREVEAKAEPFSIIRDKLGSGQFGPEMVVIPAGEFLMGSPIGELNLSEDERAHENEVSKNGDKRQMRIWKSFALGRYLVTRDEYFTYLKAMGGEPPNNDTSENGSYPIVNVSWNDAQKYIAWLNKETGKTYRLPSEAEWEYSCRAGTDTRRCWGDAWNKDKANGAESIGHTSPVNQYPPNMWGIYDMIGNVWEWCEDIYLREIDRLPDGGAPYVSPSGDADRKQGSPPVRVQRGGAFTSSPRRLRCANRNWENPHARDSNVGFRLARRIDV